MSKNVPTYSPRLGKLPPIVAITSLLLLAFVATVRSDYTTYENGNVISITILVPWMFYVIVAAVVLTLVMCVATAVACFKTGRHPWAVLLFTIPLLGCPYSIFRAFTSNLAPWTIEATLAGPDGKVYAFLDSSFMQGQTMALGRVRSRNFLATTYDVLGETNGDSPRYWASVVRPAGAPADDYGQLYASPDGVIVGIRYDHKCYFTFDSEKGEFIGGAAVKVLPPFVLMRPNTNPHQPDIDAIVEEIKSREPGMSGRPDPATLHAALEHANPSVRDAAKLMLDAQS